MKTTHWLILGFLLVQGSVFAQMEAFQTANEAYRNEKFTVAIEAYETLLNEGYQSAELEYNLGNAYYRTSEIGEAILHYERALRLKPGDDDIQHNLQIARQLVQGTAVDVLEFRAWKNVVQTFTASGWSVFGLLLLWLAAGGFVVWQIGKSRRYRKWGFIAGIVLLVLSALPFTMAVLRTQVDATHDQGVVVQYQVVLRSAPDAESKEVKPLFEGTTVQLLDTIENWYKIQLADGDQGWLLQTDFVEI